MRARGQRIGMVLMLSGILALLAPGISAAHAQMASAMKAVVYRGYTVTIPRSWPVLDLARRPRTCVRFDRHALYLGVPGAVESCPAHMAGRSEAILIEPLGATVARAGQATGLAVPHTAATSFSSGDVRIIATWSRARDVIARALHRRSLPPPAPPRPTLAVAARLHLAADARASQPGAHTADAVFTGSGFDACSAPSAQAMTAWGTSPYRALGIYIGGVNSACAQPNLSSSWVASESAAGWNMIPTYVGLQAPSNGCGCAAISPSQASAEGTAAAEDAVTAAQTLGLSPGNPIYDDMEAYSRTSANTTAVLAFLAAWTTQLHAAGYLSGVYSSTNSGIADLVAQYGTSYPEPDEIWIADWNGQATTTDTAVPTSDWPNHQRLHQYRGGHNETYGGVTINIDSDYVDAATATGAATTIPPPTLAVSPTTDGTTNLTAGWGGSGLVSWEVLAGTSPTTLGRIASASAHGATTKIAVRSAAPYFAVQAVGPSAQPLATSSTVTAPSHLLVFGHSVFVSARSGMAGLPTGCFLPNTCHVVTTVSAGRQTLVKTGTESVGPGADGLVFFKLTGGSLKRLNTAPNHRLPVQITVRDVSGASITAKLVLIPFSTSGRAPTHSLTPDPLFRALGVTDFVYAHGAGGALAACTAVYACRISATVSVGSTTIASTHPEIVNGREAGYVQFSLTRQGRQMLDHAAGNQLGANLTLRSGSDVARARISLVQFN